MAVLPLSSIACFASATRGWGADVPTAKAIADLAPRGRIVAAINLGNPVLAQRDAGTGALAGVSVDLARELARRAGVPVEFAVFDAAGKVFDALDRGVWDVAFLAIQPERAEKVSFSAPYVSIDSTYLVWADSPFRAVADLDRDGVRIAVAKGAAYDLYLSRVLTRAKLIRASTPVEAAALFRAERLDALAGIRQQLVQVGARAADLRVLPDSYSRVEQAIGVPKGRTLAAAYVADFLEAMKRSGFVRRSLDASGQAGASTAPRATPGPG